MKHRDSKGITRFIDAKKGLSQNAVTAELEHGPSRVRSKNKK